MSRPWSVQNAKAKLSEVLSLARAGKPQRIGLTDSCIIVAEAAWTSRERPNLGAWLVESAPRGDALELPTRASRRGDPFHRPRRPKARS